jgi:hypothetical protein
MWGTSWVGSPVTQSFLSGRTPCFQ